jgi:hypothetical protein
LKFTERGEIEVACRIYDEHTIYFSVRDTGSGIRPELKVTIFERFRQGDTPESHEGTGLGLAISKAYVELLGGNIGVESEPGKGSLFYFTLPFEGKITALRQPLKKNGNVEIPLATKKILIVEDDELSFILLTEILKNQNLEIIRACQARFPVSASASPTRARSLHPAAQPSRENATTRPAFVPAQAGPSWRSPRWATSDV